MWTELFLNFVEASFILLCSPGWLQTHNNPLVLGSQTCATIPNSPFFWTGYSRTHNPPVSDPWMLRFYKCDTMPGSKSLIDDILSLLLGIAKFNCIWVSDKFIQIYFPSFSLLMSRHHLADRNDTITCVTSLFSVKWYVLSYHHPQTRSYIPNARGCVQTKYTAAALSQSLCV